MAPGSAHSAPGPLMSRARAILVQTSVAAMSGSRALPLLCRKTRALPPDVLRLVRECLRVPLGPRCPRWISDLLWIKLSTLPRGRNSLITVSFNTVQTIEFGAYRTDESDFGMNGPRPCHMPTHSGLPSYTRARWTSRRCGWTSSSSSRTAEATGC